MRTTGPAWIATACLAVLIGGFAPVPDEEPEASKLAMTPAIACAKIGGYADFVPLDEPAVTRDDKLLIYYEVSGFDTRTVGKEYRVHLVQDAKIRRRGEKTVLRAKDKLVEYDGRSKQRPQNVYLTNSISLKPFPPGEYDLEIILHDELGKSSPSRQVLPFRVKPTAAVSPKAPEDR